jgi:UDPglucose 6-dehydrogenase
MRAAMKEPVIFDGRNLYDLESMKESGFYYASIGRAVVGRRTVQSPVNGKKR